MKKIKITFWIIGFGCGVMVTAMISILLVLNILKSAQQIPHKSDYVMEATIEATTEDLEESTKQNSAINIKDETNANIEKVMNTEAHSNQTEIPNTLDKQDAIEEESETQKTCVITITDDLSGQDICNLLEEKGLVDDAESFRHYIWSQNKQRALHSGTITLPYGLSYEELLSWLTT